MNLRFHASLSAEELTNLAVRQLNGLFPDGDELLPQQLAPAVRGALSRLEHCFAHINNKYFFDGTRAIFNHLHGDQYSMWLYFLGNELYRTRGSAAACSKLFLLNKALHGCDVFYEVELPSIFLFVHPLGTVLGRGRYSDYLLVYQRCGVGSNHGVYPTLGRHLTLRPGSAVLGSCTVGDNCSIATESLLLDKDLPSDSVYIGNPRDHLIRNHELSETLWRT